MGRFIPVRARCSRDGGQRDVLVGHGLLLDVLAADALAGVRAGDLGLVALAVVLQAARPLAVAALVVPPLPVVGQTTDLEQNMKVLNLKEMLCWFALNCRVLQTHASSMRNGGFRLQHRFLTGRQTDVK